MDFVIYLLVAIGLAIIVDFSVVIVRLGQRGVVMVFKYLFLGKVYRDQVYSISRDSGARILVLGDSSGSQPGAALEESLAARLASKYDVSVTNICENGGTIREITARLASVDGKSFDLAIVFAGNNDLKKLTDLRELRSDMGCLLDKLRENSRRVILFRGGNIGSFPIFPMSLSWIWTRRARTARAMLISLAADKGVVYVEKWMERKDDIFLKDYRRYYDDDMIHLNGEGLKVWFDCLEEKMKENGIRLPEKKLRSL